MDKTQLTSDELEQRFEEETLALFRVMTGGYDPENCPSEIEAELLYEIEDSSD